jgi:CDP-paratose 2-epimerase
VAWLLIAAVTGQPISIFGDGKQVRDLLWVDDLLDLYEVAIERIDVAAGQVYNVGGGPKNTLAVWRELGPMLAGLLRRDIPVTYHDWRPGDQYIFVADVRKAECELGWQPATSREDGVRRLCEWVVENEALFA